MAACSIAVTHLSEIRGCFVEPVLGDRMLAARRAREHRNTGSRESGSSHRERRRQAHLVDRRREAARARHHSPRPANTVTGSISGSTTGTLGTVGRSRPASVPGATRSDSSRVRPGGVPLASGVRKVRQGNLEGTVSNTEKGCRESWRQGTWRHPCLSDAWTRRRDGGRHVGAIPTLRVVIPTTHHLPVPFGCHSR